MDNKIDKHCCRVCGLFLGEDYLPWGEDNRSSTFDICECCGVTFGYQDCFPEDAKRYREKWLAKGALWDEPKYKPENWSLEEQLKNIPEGFR